MNNKLRFHVIGVGHYLPPFVKHSEELERELGKPPNWIRDNFGVLQRRWADRSTDTNATMGAMALREALVNGGLDISDLDMIINASGTPQQLVPDTAALIQRELGQKAQGIPCFSVHATCLSFLVAFNVAISLLNTGGHRRIAIVSSEIGSAAINMCQPESAALIGDGAAALILAVDSSETVTAELLAFRLETYGQLAHLTQVVGGGTFLRGPEYSEDNKKSFLFDMDGSSTLKHALRLLPKTINAALNEAGLTLMDIDLVIPHQASSMGLKIAEHVGIDKAKVLQTLATLGNTVAASIPLTWYEGVAQGRIKEGMKIMLIGTGAGLSVGVMILQL